MSDAEIERRLDDLSGQMRALLAAVTIALGTHQNRKLLLSILEKSEQALIGITTPTPVSERSLESQSRTMANLISLVRGIEP